MMIIIIRRMYLVTFRIFASFLITSVGGRFWDPVAVREFGGGGGRRERERDLNTIKHDFNSLILYEWPKFFLEAKVLRTEKQQNLFIYVIILAY